MCQYDRAVISGCPSLIFTLGDFDAGQFWRVVVQSSLPFAMKNRTIGCPPPLALRPPAAPASVLHVAVKISGYICLNVLKPLRSPGPSFRRKLDNALEVTSSAGRATRLHTSPPAFFFPFAIQTSNDQMALAIANTWPLGLCLCGRCASILERLYPLEYTDMPPPSPH